MSGGYDDLNDYYGDIHTHCGISYGHGPLEDALKNASQQLDFVSITGHAHWPDMPEPDERIQYILDFHHEGFARLKECWERMMKTLRIWDKQSQMVIFPGFEIHMNADGDRTIMYKNLEGEIIYTKDLTDLHKRMDEFRSRDESSDILSFPHHIAYRVGTRGINWKTFLDDHNEPFVELISMHGCSETNENTRPFLHSMGGSDYESTIQYGLSQGKVFGFCGSTDHHSGHPGSYGHGATGVWARSKDREGIWEALRARRMYAITGDRIKVKFSVDGYPMGSVIEKVEEEKEARMIEFDVYAGGAIDYVDIVKNNRLFRRFSECDCDRGMWDNPRNLEDDETMLRTKLYLELGWGERKVVTPWEVRLGVSEGRIIKIEPRFRGREVVSPVEQELEEEGEEEKKSTEYFTSRWEAKGDRFVHFFTKSLSNPNNMTCTTQGMCIEVEVPLRARILATLVGKVRGKKENCVQEVEENIPIRKLIQGARTGHLLGDQIDSPGYRFNRAPLPYELRYRFSLKDEEEAKDGDFYYLRVKQKNDQWAWSSPVFFRKKKEVEED